jgi:hypothetical protein
MKFQTFQSLRFRDTEALVLGQSAIRKWLPCKEGFISKVTHEGGDFSGSGHEVFRIKLIVSNASGGVNPEYRVEI